MSNVLSISSDSSKVKRCSTCGIDKAYSEFNKQSGCKDGLRSNCKVCRSIYAKTWRDAHKAKHPGFKAEEYRRNKNTYKNQMYKAKYGITLEDYNKLFTTQEGQCKCCGIHQVELDRSLAVDHCHTTGIIRGLLCNNCNRMLGLAKDSIAVLRNMIEYLQNV